MNERKCPVCGKAMSEMVDFYMCENTKCPSYTGVMGEELSLQFSDETYADRLEKENAELRKEITDLRVRIENGIIYIEQMPAVDETADPNNTSPDDMIAHLSGLALQALKGVEPC